MNVIRNMIFRYLKEMNMRIRNLCGAAAVLVVAVLGLSGCVGTNADKKGNAPSSEISKADQYAIDVLGTYYLWNEEIEKDLRRLDPDTCRMPMEVVESIRYREGGKEGCFPHISVLSIGTTRTGTILRRLM